MKDFPVFTTENGVASLILKEIPYRRVAYIRIQDTLSPEVLTEECVSFCRACGAERVFASGHSWLERYPLYTALWEMRGIPAVDAEMQENLWPVTKENASQWRRIYNEKMLPVDNARTLEVRDEAELVQSGAYFVHSNGDILGIGWLRDQKLEAVASLKSGMGERILHTLFSLCPEQSVTLEVASTNKKAVALYEKMGFLKTRELSRWYEIK